MERRSHPRYRLTGRVWCEGDGFTLHARALNMSLGGVFVRAASPPSAGRRLRLVFKDEVDSSEIVAEAEVAWVRGNPRPGMGLRILAFERGSEAFQRFVERQGKQDGELEEA